MKNLQKLALGLTVGAMAIGFSAFKSDVKVNRFATVYYQDSLGNYTKTPPGSMSECITEPNPCSLQFPNDIPAGQFDKFNYSTELGAVTAIGGTPTPSPQNGVWD